MNKSILSILLILSIFSCGKDSGGGGTTPPATLPSITIQNTEIRENEGTQVLDVEFTLNNSNGTATTFDLNTSDRTAVAGSDYESLSTQVTIPGTSDASATQSITILGDLDVESNEQFTLELTNITNADVTNKSVSINIVNDDAFNLKSGSLTVSPNIPTTGATSPTSYPGMSLVWSDEFTGDGLNELDWTFEIGDGCPNLCGWGNNELEHYTDKNAVIHDNDYLVIEARQESNPTYTSTRMITKDKVEFKYGRIDIRASLPKGQGIWPAIWMLGDNIDDVSWPACGEIDIMELVGHEAHKSHSTVHYGSNSANHKFTGRSYSLDPSNDFSNEFHVFSLEWTLNSLVFHVDGQESFSFTSANVQNNQPYPFNNEFFMILNIAVGGNWPGSPDSSTSFPQHMIVDYIRVFQ